MGYHGTLFGVIIENGFYGIIRLCFKKFVFKHKGVEFDVLKSEFKIIDNDLQRVIDLAVFNFIFPSELFDVELHPDFQYSIYFELKESYQIEYNNYFFKEYPKIHVRMYLEEEDDFIQHQGLILTELSDERDDEKITLTDLKVFTELVQKLKNEERIESTDCSLSNDYTF